MKTIKLEWNERFSVGVAALDAQHRELMSIINLLVDNAEASADSEFISEVLDRMTQYAGYHFHTEERMLSEYGYPGHSSHEKEHTEFKGRIARFCLEAIQEKRGLGHEILSYLSSWLSHHILSLDMKYKPFFQEKGLK